MRYLITGATGFIGGALARHLIDRRNYVAAIARDSDAPDGCKVVRGDIEDIRTCERAISEHEPDVVFHLAAQAMVGQAKRDPFSTLESNVRGTYNMLEAMRRQGGLHAKFVMASSDKAYGHFKMDQKTYMEEDPLEGTSPYDVSKSCADLIAQSYGHTYGLNVRIVRAGNVYGPGDLDQSRIVPSVMNALKRYTDPVIMSDGTPVRDYLFIEDAVAAYCAVANASFMSLSSPEAFNFSGGQPISVLELVKKIISKTTKLASPEIRGTRTGEIQTQVLDCSKAHSVLGWTPIYSLDLGLQLTWNWWDNREFCDIT